MPFRTSYHREPQRRSAMIARTLPGGSPRGGAAFGIDGRAMGPNGRGCGWTSIELWRGTLKSLERFPPRDDVQHRRVRPEDEGPRGRRGIEVPRRREPGPVPASRGRRNRDAELGEHELRPEGPRDAEATDGLRKGPRRAHPNGPGAREAPGRDRRRPGPARLLHRLRMQPLGGPHPRARIRVPGEYPRGRDGRDGDGPRVRVDEGGPSPEAP